MAFVIVVQPSASVLRAAVMGAITLLAVVSHRRRQAIPVLSATVIALMIAAPELAVDVGFALSVSATAALVVIAPAWSRRLVERGWPKPLADAVSVAVAAQLVTAPLVAGISGTFSVVAVVANLAVAGRDRRRSPSSAPRPPRCPLWPAGAQLLIRFTGPELWWLLRVARWAAGMPGCVDQRAVGSARRGVLSPSQASPRWWRGGGEPVRIGAGLAAMCLLAWTLSGLSGGHDTIVQVSEEVAGLHLVLGDEELLVERAVAAVLRQARKQAGTDDVPVNRHAGR